MRQKNQKDIMESGHTKLLIWSGMMGRSDLIWSLKRHSQAQKGRFKQMVLANSYSRRLLMVTILSSRTAVKGSKTPIFGMFSQIYQYYSLARPLITQADTNGLSDSLYTPDMVVQLQTLHFCWLNTTFLIFNIIGISLVLRTFQIEKEWGDAPIVVILM